MLVSNLNDQDTPCEECDKSEAVIYCQSCEQQLCIDCDKKIHNKGKRALHERSELHPQKNYLK